MTPVIIATPCFGGVLTTGYFLSFLNSVPPLIEAGFGPGVYTINNESLIPRARNRCAAHFLSTDAQKLIFIDADISWKPEHLLTLLRSYAPLVAGTYPTKAYPLELNFNATEEHRAKYFPDGVRSLEKFSKYRRAEGDEVPVSHLATGFMVIAREVLEALKSKVPSYDYRCQISGEVEEHWDFFPLGVVGRSLRSEDWAFSELAREAGFTPYLNTSVIVDHYGSHNFSASQEKW